MRQTNHLGWNKYKNQLNYKFVRSHPFPSLISTCSPWMHLQMWHMAHVWHASQIFRHITSRILLNIPGFFFILLLGKGLASYIHPWYYRGGRFFKRSIIIWTHTALTCTLAYTNMLIPLSCARTHSPNQSNCCEYTQSFNP